MKGPRIIVLRLTENGKDVGDILAKFTSHNEGFKLEVDSKICAMEIPDKFPLCIQMANVIEAAIVKGLYTDPEKPDLEALVRHMVEQMKTNREK